MKVAFLDSGLQIKWVYKIQGGFVIHRCNCLLFVKHSTTDGVNAVDHISRMAKFYNLWCEESSTQMLPHIVFVYD